MEHTKGKWEVEFETTYSGGTIKAVLENGKKEFICTTSGNARANARRICTCVNSHDDLLAACKLATTLVVMLPIEHQKMDIIKQAIAKAEEKEQ